jgi:hypothetical protein
MNPITEAVLKAGLVSPEMLREMRRFSPVLDEAETDAPADLETAARLVELALQSEQYVFIRETDLEVLHQYAMTTESGVLHVETDSETVDVPVVYGRTPIGEFIVPWKSESIKELMTNGLTYLVTATAQRVFFHDVRELHYGTHKAFMVCVPSMTESPDVHNG